MSVEGIGGLDPRSRIELWGVIRELVTRGTTLLLSTQYLEADVRGQHLRALRKLPGPLRAFAEWNRVSSVTQAARGLFGNIRAGTPTPDARSLQHPVLYTLAWAVVTVAAFAPLSAARYQRAGRS